MRPTKPGDEYRPLRRYRRRMAMARAIALLGICSIVLALVPAAGASQSSIDAYAGEALVLGKPTHRHRPPPASGTGSGRATGHGLQSTGGQHPGAQAPGGGSATSVHNVTGPRTSSDGTSSSTPSGYQLPTHGRIVVSPSKTAKSSAHPTNEVPSVFHPEAAAGNASLSGLDWILVALGVAGLATLAMLLRRIDSTSR